MTRQADGPWFRKSKNAWFATLPGKRMVNLKVKGEGNRPEANKAWHRLMAGLPHNPLPLSRRKEVKEVIEASAPKPVALTVAGLVAAYLNDARERVGSASFRNYEHFLTLFARQFGKRPAGDIKPYEAEASSRRPDWSATYRANYLNVVVMAFRWAARAGLIAANPLAGVRKPNRTSRGASAAVSEDEYHLLIAHARPDTNDLLVMLWNTGARPAEITGLTAEMVKASADGVIPLTAHKTAHKGKPRFLILHGEAWEVAKRRANAVGYGLLFPSDTGGRLTTQAIGHRLKKLCRRAGVRHLMAYGFRHGYATDALCKGVPDATVAALLGHGSTAMLFRHYSHLTARTDVLRQAAARVR
ncbi:MAG: tyrosine-type recombinase/integrase [Gemmataceae bacterium]